MTTETINNLTMPTDAQVAAAIENLENEQAADKKKRASKAPVVGQIFMKKEKGKIVFFRAIENPADMSGLVEDTWLGAQGVKAINGFTADLLGVEKVGGDKDGKKTAIARFFKAAFEKLPLSEKKSAEGDKPKKKAASDKPEKAPKTFTVTFDPTSEEQALAFEQLAPQGKACVLAALGLKHPPKQAKTATVVAKELEAVLEAGRAAFETEQPLKRIWGYHRPMLVAGGFLKVEGSAGGSRATDGYIYHFHFTPTAKNVEKFDALPPQAQACVLVAFGRKKVTAEGDKLEKEILGSDWRNLLFKAKASGALKTKQNPFRIFQYHEHLLVEAGFLNVRS